MSISNILYPNQINGYSKIYVFSVNTGVVTCTEIDCTGEVVCDGFTNSGGMNIVNCTATGTITTQNCTVNGTLTANNINITGNTTRDALLLDINYVAPTSSNINISWSTTPSSELGTYISNTNSSFSSITTNSITIGKSGMYSCGVNLGFIYVQSVVDAYNSIQLQLIVTRNSTPMLYTSEISTGVAEMQTSGSISIPLMLQVGDIVTILMDALTSSAPTIQIGNNITTTLENYVYLYKL